MSIEKNIEEATMSLKSIEILLELMNDMLAKMVDVASAVPLEAETPVKEELTISADLGAQVVVVPEPPISLTPTPPVEEEKEVPQEVVLEEIITLEELNTELMKEYERRGNDRTPIDEVLKEYGVTGLKQVDPAQYIELLDKVKAK